jgi:hypothetical protein
MLKWEAATVATTPLMAVRAVKIYARVQRRTAGQAGKAGKQAGIEAGEQASIAA